MSDCDLSIGSNLIERTLPAQAIGRKNYLFVGSDRGGGTAASLSSFVCSCKRIGGDLFADLKDVFEGLPSHPAGLLSELLPDARLAAHPRALRKVAV